MNEKLSLDAKQKKSAELKARLKLLNSELSCISNRSDYYSVYILDSDSSSPTTDFFSIKNIDRRIKLREEIEKTKSELEKILGKSNCKKSISKILGKFTSQDSAYLPPLLNM